MGFEDAIYETDNSGGDKKAVVAETISAPEINIGEKVLELTQQRLSDSTHRIILFEANHISQLQQIEKLIASLESTNESRKLYEESQESYNVLLERYEESVTISDKYKSDLNSLLEETKILKEDNRKLIKELEKLKTNGQ